QARGRGNGDLVEYAESERSVSVSLCRFCTDCRLTPFLGRHTPLRSAMSRPTRSLSESSGWVVGSEARRLDRSSSVLSSLWQRKRRADRYVVCSRGRRTWLLLGSDIRS